MHIDYVYIVYTYTFPPYIHFSFPICNSCPLYPDELWE